ncbi:MAG: 4Fe-4S binding protein, partial [Chloroflexota bacterium]
MKQLVILSGKGGTGKTSIAAAFAHLLSLDDVPFRAVLVDADVDASNLELVLSPKIIFREDFWGGQFARIDEDICTGCGICEDVCRFDAIWYAGELGTGKLVNWETGKLVNRGTGKLVNRGTSKLVNRGTGKLVNWETGKLVNRGTG